MQKILVHIKFTIVHAQLVGIRILRCYNKTIYEVIWGVWVIVWIRKNLKNIIF